MRTEYTWIVTKVDGRIASVSLDYSGLARVLVGVRKLPVGKTNSISSSKVSSDELYELCRSLCWEDLCLFGTDFQKKIWRELFRLNHDGAEPRLMSYSEFATICGNRPGIRAVAHAIGLNPVPVLIPCHRIIPKPSIDRIAEIEAAAQKTLFKGADLFLFDAIDFGEYALGKSVKRDILAFELSKQ